MARNGEVRWKERHVSSFAAPLDAHGWHVHDDQDHESAVVCVRMEKRVRWTESYGEELCGVKECLERKSQ